MEKKTFLEQLKNKWELYSRLKEIKMYHLQLKWVNELITNGSIKVNGKRNDGKSFLVSHLLVFAGLVGCEVVYVCNCRIINGKLKTAVERLGGSNSNTTYRVSTEKEVDKWILQDYDNVLVIWENNRYHTLEVFWKK